MPNSSSGSGASTHGLVQELKGLVCRCGAPKNAAHTFCGKCYFALPLNRRQALYQRIGEGYEEAYAAALAVLRDAGMVA